MNFLLVFIGGGIGSVLRYAIGIGFQKTSLSLPVATLVSNVTACILFALTLNFIDKSENPAALKLLALTGFCGGLSTFSTFGYETFLLMKQQAYGWTAINIILNLTLCIGSFILIRR